MKQGSSIFDFITHRKNNQNRKRNKRASADFIFLIIIAFLMAIVFIVMYKFIAVLSNSGFTDNDASDSTSVKIKNEMSNSRALFDALFVLFYFGTVFGIGVASYQLRTNSLFLLGLWIMLTVLILVASRFSDAFSGLTTTGLFSEALSSFPMTNYIMQHLALFYWLSGTLIISIMFGIGKTGDG